MDGRWPRSSASRKRTSSRNAVGPIEGALIEASSTIRRRVVAHGQVQGVFFRNAVKERAQAQGISGWARNRADGSMEACFEGMPSSVEALVAFCAAGPERARVSRLDEVEEEPQGLRGFRVR